MFGNCCPKAITEMGIDRGFLPVWCVRFRRATRCLALGTRQVAETLSWTKRELMYSYTGAVSQE